MVQNFEVILASGDIVNANIRENPDIFQALKGGSNNFGIITRFGLKTFVLGKYFGGFNYYYGNQSVQLLEAFASFVSNPNFDTKAAVITSTVYSGTQGFVTTCILAYTEAVMNPPVLKNFTSGIQPLVSNLRISNLSGFSGTLGVNQPNNFR
jgi:FAD/FMN-containing dehydrogenase